MKLKSELMKQQAKTNLLELKKRGKFATRTGAPPEVQIHCAATLIDCGDPFAKMKEKKEDVPMEIGQWCVRFAENNSYGTITEGQIDMSLQQFKQHIMQRLREYGALRNGE